MGSSTNGGLLSAVTCASWKSLRRVSRSERSTFATSSRALRCAPAAYSASRALAAAARASDAARSLTCQFCASSRPATASASGLSPTTKAVRWDEPCSTSDAALPLPASPMRKTAHLKRIGPAIWLTKTIATIVAWKREPQPSKECEISAARPSETPACVRSVSHMCVLKRESAGVEPAAYRPMIAPRAMDAARSTTIMSAKGSDSTIAGKLSVVPTYVKKMRKTGGPDEASTAWKWFKCSE